jgi:selenocysteine-specific elongation factor
MALTARQSRFLDRVLAAIESAPVNTPSEPDLARSLGVPIQAVEEIVRLGAENERILVLRGSVLFTRDQISQIQRRLKELAAPGPFSPKQVRESLGTTRKYADALLDYFDSTGFTERTEQGRTCRA